MCIHVNSSTVYTAIQKSSFWCLQRAKFQFGCIVKFLFVLNLFANFVIPASSKHNQVKFYDNLDFGSFFLLVIKYSLMEKHVLVNILIMYMVINKLQLARCCQLQSGLFFSKQFVIGDLEIR